MACRVHKEEVFLSHAYAHQRSLVKQVLREKAHATPGILEQPGVKIGTVKYEETGIAYRVRFLVNGYQDRLI